LHLGRGIDLHAAKLFGHAEGADADPIGRLEDLARQTLFRFHQPFALPIGTDKGDDEIVHKGAAALAHEPLLFSQTAIDHVHHLSPPNAAKPQSKVGRSRIKAKACREQGRKARQENRSIRSSKFRGSKQWPMKKNRCCKQIRFPDLSFEF
jgi:hypothetical protein